jgi:PAS domain S-box-containing protein
MLTADEPKVSVEYRIARPDGSVRRVRDRGFQVRDEAGVLIRLTGIVTDITERGEAQTASLRLAAIVESSDDAMISKDLHGLITSWSRGAEKVFGYTAQEMVGTPITRLIPADRRGDEAHILGRIRRGKSVEHFETQRQTADGRLIDVSVTASPIRDAMGHVIGASKVARDITAQRAAEQSIRVQAHMLDNGGQAVIATDLTGYVTYANRFAQELYGWPDAEMLGRKIMDVTVAQNTRDQAESIMERLHRGEAWSGEFQVQHRDGRQFPAFVTNTPLRNDEGAVIGIVGISEDLTERKQAAEAQAARQLADRGNAAKSEFLSRMSHELRTPMNAILGFAQVLDTEEGLSPDQHDSVGQILKGGSHLLNLINEVLDISSIDSGRLTISSEAVALAGLLEETAALLRPMSAEFNARIVLQSSNEECYVLADRQRLKQVLLNLLSNAIKYNRPGGSVTVRLNEQGAAAATARISVSDDGPGLTAEKIARLFHPFDRLGTEQTRVEGTGFGLVLAKRIVEHMGGVLGVESVVGEGTTFWVELPTAEPPLEEEAPAGEGIARMTTEISACSRALLYIEDNPSNVRLVTGILARRPGLRLLSAETGARGVEMAREHRPDLILLDLHLPDSQGDEVLRRLATDPRTGAIPVVMLTANAVPGVRDQMLAAGARAFIVKPMVIGEFLRMVDQLLA